MIASKEIIVLGGGLAGSEAAYTVANQGVRVRLVEMRPGCMTPAHHTEKFAELVCSNSLGGEGETNAKGLLQAEMRYANSLIMRAADKARVPAGGALAVDREIFSQIITHELTQHPLITVIREEAQSISLDSPTILATGPLTSQALANCMRQLLGDKFLSFYDAAAPVVLGETINQEICFRAGRYAQAADYWNCPFNETAYERFYGLLSEARKHIPHDWERLEFFAGCMPVEELARRGYQTLLFGPLKPKGLMDPRTGKEPFAVVQLRADDKEQRMWSLVGFQTGLKWPDQKTVVQAIPGLENAEIIRYGVMHRNTYLNAPLLIHPTLQFRAHKHLFVAGVLCGVEGYLESAATGWLAGMNAVRYVKGKDPLLLPPESMLGGLVRFLANASSNNFQPMNANWGLVPSLSLALSKKERRARMFARGLSAFSEIAFFKSDKCQGVEYSDSAQH